MAFVATFTADFTNFDKQLEQASKSFKGLETDAKSVQRQFDRMVKDFSGTRITQEAGAMAKAIGDVTNVSKLTAAEMKRVSATVTEALEKYDKLGEEAPADIKRLAAELKRLDTTQKDVVQGVSKWSVSMADLKGGLLIAGAAATAMAAAVGAALGKFVQFGSELTDMSAKTGVSTDGLQRLKFAAEQSGVGFEQAVKGVQMLSARLAGNDKSALRAVDALGLSLQELRAAGPERAFEQIAAAAGKIEDPMAKSRIAMDLFGRSGMDLLPVLSAEFAALAQKAEDLGIVMDEKLVKAADELGDLWDILKAQTMTLIAQALAPMVPLLVDLANLLANLATTIGPKVAAFFNQLAVLTLKASVEFAEFAVKYLKFASLFSALPGFKDAPKFLQSWETSLGNLRLSLYLAENGVLFMSKAVDKATPGFKAMELSTGGAAKGVKALGDELAKLTGADKITAAQKLADNIAKIGLARVDPAQWKAIATAMEDAIKAGERLGIEIPQAFRDILAALRPVVPAFEAWKHVIEEIEVRARKLVGTWKDGFAALPGIIRPATEAIEDARNGTKDADDAAKSWSKTLDNLGTAFAELAQSSNQDLARVAASIGRIVSALKLLDKSLEAIQQGGFGNIIAGIGGIVAAFDQATSSASRAQNAIGGFMTGFQTGFQLSGGNPIVGLVTGGLSALFGFFRRTDSEARKLRDQLFAAAGGVNALREQFERANLGQHWNEFMRATNPRDVQRWFNMVQANIARLEARLTDLSDALQKTVQHNLALTREQFAEMAALAGEPAADEAIFQFMQAQAGNANDAILAIATNLTLTEKSAAGAAAALGATFAELRRQGMSAREAFETVRPAMEAVRTQLERLGIGGGEAFDVINAQWHLFAREGVPEVMDGIAGIADAITSMHNLRLLTPEMFEQLASGLVGARDQLLALGLTHEQTLAAMAPDIQRIWELQQDFNYAVDAATQALIDEAVAAGKVGDEFRSSESQMAQAIKRLVDSINALIVTLGGDLPDAAKDAADGIQGHLDRIRPPTIRVPVELGDIPDWRVYAERGTGGRGDLPAFATGSGGLRDFGTGTLAMLHGREAVLTEAQIRRLTTPTAAAPVSVAITVHAIDAKGVKDFVESPDFGRSFTQSIRQNVQGRRSDTRAALGVS